MATLVITPGRISPLVVNAAAPANDRSLKGRDLARYAAISGYAMLAGDPFGGFTTGIAGKGGEALSLSGFALYVMLGTAR